MSPWLTTREACEHLRISRAMLHKLVARGRVRRRKMRGSTAVRYRRDELDALLGWKGKEVGDAGTDTETG